MASEITEAFLQEQIDATKAAITAYHAAILALSSGAQSYSLDTGQTKQSVTKANLTELRKTLDWLNKELRQLDDELNGGGGNYYGTVA
jgi:uncharacterized coiled-coil DUF342 family protein